MPRKIDIAGKKFGWLTAIERVENVRDRPAWLCRCDCGNVKVIVRASLTGRHSARSCGCLKSASSRANIAGWNEHRRKPDEPTPQSLESARDAGRMLDQLWGNRGHNEMRAERDAARADARRYQWLRQRFRVFSPHIDGQHAWCATGDVGRLRGPNLDAAIDAALRDGMAYHGGGCARCCKAVCECQS